jgi:hypothetical protein
MTVNEIKQIIKEEYLKIEEELYKEVYSDKQRAWACAHLGDDFKGEKELTKKQAKEMCTGPVKKEISSMGSGAVSGAPGAIKKDKLIREEDLIEKIMNILISKENE